MIKVSLCTRITPRYPTIVLVGNIGPISLRLSSVANHQRAAVDLLYRDFFIWHKEGRTVDMYGWIDTDELIRAIFDDFQIIVDDLSTTSSKINPATWQNYQDWIWKMAA